MVNDASTTPAQAQTQTQTLHDSSSLSSSHKITSTAVAKAGIDTPPPSPSCDEKHDSAISIAPSNQTSASHQEYLDTLEVPTPHEFQRIAMVQEEKEAAIEARHSEELSHLDHEERHKAAGVIQRNYRGYRERRQLEGMGLDPTTRWMEALKEARYRNITQPKPRESSEDQSPVDGPEGGPTASIDSRRQSGTAMQNWRKVAAVARRAGEDDLSDVSSDEEGLSQETKEERRKLRHEETMSRQKAAKQMDLQYFLEMVDHKHRYGSNLRKYHEVWKKADTNENFFYWLDYGEGRNIDTEGCNRERLDREQVRYLSKEERLDYLVKIDDEGRLYWAKNGQRIDTTEDYRDSIHGIVPADDPAPIFRGGEVIPNEVTAPHHGRSSSSSSSSNEHENENAQLRSDDDEAAEAGKYANPDLSEAPALKKIKHVSAATIFNRLLRTTVKKNTWIFVADTSFRLYVGIKQSGAFQHSSFLHGSRISAAGLIKIKNGRLSKLSPLSGHYRPPAANFRAFVHSLRDRGVDMSHVSISRSYAVLVGLEAYVRTRRKGKHLVEGIVHAKDVVLHPAETRQKELEARDKSESAEKERQYLAKTGGQVSDGGILEKIQQFRLGEDAKGQPLQGKKAAAAAAVEQKHQPATNGLTQRAEEEGSNKSDLVNGEKKPRGKYPVVQDSEPITDSDLQVPGSGPESHIAPEGTRRD